MAGSNVYILGTTFENTADRLVAYGLVARDCGTSASSIPPGLEGETARDAVSAAVSRRGATLATSQPYSLSVEGIQAAAGAGRRGADSAGANAVDPDRRPDRRARLHLRGAARQRRQRRRRRSSSGMQRWDVSAEALAVPSLQGGVFAAPDPALVGAFNGRYRAAYGESPHELAGLAYDGDRRGRRADRRRPAAQGGSPFSTARLTQPAGFAGVNGAVPLPADGRVQRNLAIIEVRDGQAVVTESRGEVV